MKEKKTMLSESKELETLDPTEIQTEPPREVRKEIKIKRPFFWQSACFRVDPRFAIFAVQFIISCCVLGVCVGKLILEDSCETQSFYGNILMTMIGLWMPSPLSKT
jgi:hypothetical protein